MTAVWRPELIVISDAATFGDTLTISETELWCAARAPGTLMVQLRDKVLSASARLHLGKELRRITRRHGQALVINDRIDLVVLLEADGLHLAENSVGTADARMALGQDVWISRACHSPVLVDEYTDCDAIILSPVLASRKGNPALGLGALRVARQRLDAAKDADGPMRAPALYALGGATPENRLECELAGADGIAMMSRAWNQQ